MTSQGKYGFLAGRWERFILCQKGIVEEWNGSPDIKLVNIGTSLSWRQLCSQNSSCHYTQQVVMRATMASRQVTNTSGRYWQSPFNVLVVLVVAPHYPHKADSPHRSLGQLIVYQEHASGTAAGKSRQSSAAVLSVAHLSVHNTVIAHGWGFLV